MEKRTLTCINCPLGCTLTAEITDGQVTSVTGNNCKRGAAYAKEEITAPTRTVTTTVRVTNGRTPVVSVKTRQPVPKNKIRECIQALAPLSVCAPIHIGDVILENIADTGISVVATSNDLCCSTEI